MKPIHILTLAAQIATLVSVGAADWAEPAPISGPVNLRNQSPYQLLFLNFAPQSGDTLGRGEQATTFSLDIGNDLLIPAPSPNAVHIDTETQRLDYGMRRGLGHGLEAQIEIPIEARDGGILDPLIESYHRATGLDKPAGDDIIGRRNLSNYQSNISVTDPGGNTLFHAGSAFGLGDTTVALKQSLSRPGRLDTAGRIGIKIPTGNAGGFIGSGAVDGGVDLDFDYRASHRLTIDADFSDVDAGHATHIGRLKSRGQLGHVMIAVEYRVDGRSEWILQNDQAATAIATGNSTADGVQSGIALAYRRQWGSARAWYIAFTENGDIANYEAPWLADNGPDVIVSGGIELVR